MLCEVISGCAGKFVVEEVVGGYVEERPSRLKVEGLCVPRGGFAANACVWCMTTGGRQASLTNLVSVVDEG